VNSHDGHEPDWGYGWRDACADGCTGDIDKPYLWCELCDEELEPDNPDFDRLWAETVEKY
jgi:hypothetical protein